MLSLVACDKKESVETRTTLAVSSEVALYIWLKQVEEHTKGKMKVFHAEYIGDDFVDQAMGNDLVLIGKGTLSQAMEYYTTLEETV